MEAHYKKYHSNKAMPADLKTQVALKYHEEEHVSQLLSVSIRNAKSKCVGAKCRCKQSA